MPIYANSPAVVSVERRWSLVEWKKPSSPDRQLAHRISGREERPQLGSAANSYKKVGSGGVSDSRKLIRLSRGLGNELVGFKYPGADPSRGSRNELAGFTYPEADPTELGAWE
ncbi:hypothetical protein B296_00010215 [Ensete ventricosum]|uniref:Uncharacterized protein n=1 Tax=Ensete ventricosum TaxID=4639 RepID=A0A427AHS3_ENSVE|nr:hypothetical protein B296_00010215 [Ensete ventricosum]